MSFREAMNAALQLKGLKPADIASDTVNASYISKLQTGRVKDPTWQKALAIIRALDMYPDEFSELEDKVSQSTKEE